MITFDTTYKTNLYDMPFGLFIGVNNHFQSIVRGGVLMRNETIKSFNWIFSEFVCLMGGKEPITILTGQIGEYIFFTVIITTPRQTLGLTACLGDVQIRAKQWKLL